LIAYEFLLDIRNDIGSSTTISSRYVVRETRVNAICSGNSLNSPLWTESPNALFKQYACTRGISKEQIRQTYIEQVPMKRGCTNNDVCNAVAFRTSDQVSYMPSQAINVPGGKEIR